MSKRHRKSASVAEVLSTRSDTHTEKKDTSMKTRGLMFDFQTQAPFSHDERSDDDPLGQGIRALEDEMEEHFINALEKRH